MMSWNKAYSYVPIDFGTTIGTIENITQRSYLWNNVSGTKVKVRFSNRYGSDELILDKVVIGRRRSSDEPITDMKVITYKENEKIQIAAGEEFYSDELSWEIQAGEEIVLSVYAKEKIQVRSACQTWKANSFYTRYGVGGDFTLEQKFDEVECRNIYPYIEADPNKSNVLVGISDILIEGEESVKNITMFGDSITHMSYYSDALWERILHDYKGKATIVNRGIGGNRLLHDASYLEDRDGHGRCFGIAGMSRYQKDLFEENKPDTVLILIGVNDLMHPYLFERSSKDVVTAEDLIEGITEIITSIHEHNAKVYLGTIMPFKLEEEAWVKEAEKVRNEYNAIKYLRDAEVTNGSALRSLQMVFLILILHCVMQTIKNVCSMKCI